MARLKEVKPLAKVEDLRFASVVKAVNSVCAEHNLTLDQDTKNDIIYETYAAVLPYKFADQKLITLAVIGVLKKPGYRILDDERCITKYANNTKHLDLSDRNLTITDDEISNKHALPQRKSLHNSSADDDVYNVYDDADNDDAGLHGNALLCKELAKLGEKKGSEKVVIIAQMLRDGARIEDIQTALNTGKSKNSIRSLLQKELGKSFIFADDRRKYLEKIFPELKVRKNAKAKK